MERASRHHRGAPHTAQALGAGFVSQRHFVDGIAEEIRDALARVDGLRVIGRTSSASLPGNDEDLRAIGARLAVSHLLEGSVRKEGRRIRVTAQLVEAAGGSHLWSKTFDVAMTDLFAAEDEIADAVVEAIRQKLRLAPAASARSPRSVPGIHR